MLISAHIGITVYFFPAISWYMLISTRHVQRRKKSFQVLYQKWRLLVMDQSYLARPGVTLEALSQVPCIYVWSSFKLHSTAACFGFVSRQICVLLFSRWRRIRNSCKQKNLLDLYNNRENLRIQVKISLCFVLWAAVNTSVLKANIKKKYLDSF